MTALSRASRYIAWALRHGGDKDLSIDADGWVLVTDLLHSMHGSGFKVDVQTLLQIVAEDAKQRYAVSADGRRIRANYGHSMDVRLLTAPAAPPDVLYHGTARHSITDIKRDGLLPQARRYVHLTKEVAAAMTVGNRHGPAVVIPVDSKAMHGDGLLFYPAGKQIWLTATVPTHYLRLDALVF